MPIYFHKNEQDYQLGIWRMDESKEDLRSMLELSESDLDMYESFRSEYRKREWLTTRVLLKKLLAPAVIVTIEYDMNGKPQLFDSEFSISISHTKNFVSVLLAKYAGAGIDLETIQPRIKNISKKFITRQEEMSLTGNDNLDCMHVIWGTKEVLFKIYGKGELNFLENLSASKFQLKEKGILKGKIMKDDYKKEYSINYEKLDNLMLVYAMGN